MTREEKIAIFAEWIDGKPIEFKRKKDDDKWYAIAEPTWNFEVCSYRVKPEPQGKPYDNMAQIYSAAQIKGWWVRSKDTGRRYELFIRPDSVLLGKFERIWLSFDDLWERFKWDDGTICGVEEE